ncbi:MAG: GTPase [Halioglobus sp.]
MPIKLRIPNQDLLEFTLFELNAEEAQTWAQGLAITDTRHVVQQLRQAISELNRVNISPDVRFDIMEALRPNLQITLVALSKLFLNQPLTLPEDPRQMSELANTLHSLATTAYTMVAVHTIQQRESLQGVNPARLVCEALQRAIGFAGRKILQTYQLYQPIEPFAWLEIHQLYALAERQQLAHLPVVDKLTGSGSICKTYLRATLLGCCKANQLRQTDLAGIYEGLLDWADYIHLEDPQTGEGLFQVDLSSDQPPVYSSLYPGSSNSNSRFIDTSPLVEHLKVLKKDDSRSGKPGIALRDGTVLPSNLLDHLIGSLGTMSKRNFTRTSAGNEVTITLGLSNALYFISGGLTFHQLVYGGKTDAQHRPANPFMVPTRHHDAWEAANPDKEPLRDEADHSTEDITVDEATLANLEHQEKSAGGSSRERHRAFAVKIMDASPGGYCLEWSADLPGDIKTGDIISVSDGDDADWMIGVTRWVSQLQNAGTLVGVELLSPKAMPYAAKVVQTTGAEAELTRVLLLPEIKLVGQPHTLITPRTGFREHQKVSLIRDEEQFYIQLLRQVAATGSFAQFDFRYIKLLEDVIAEDKSGPLGAAYDSVWTNI